MIVIIIFKVVLLLQIKRLDSLNAELKSITDSVEMMELTQKNLIVFENEIKQLENRYHNYNLILTKDAKEESFLNEVAKVTRDYNVRIISIETRNRIQRKSPYSKITYLEFPYKIKIPSSYYELVNFINELENNNSRVIRLNMLNVVAKSRDIWEHGADLEISIFMKPS